jgi:hypothetical protein
VADWYALGAVTATPSVGTPFTVTVPVIKHGSDADSAGGIDRLITTAINRITVLFNKRSIFNIDSPG